MRNSINLKIGLVQGFYWSGSCVFVSFLVRQLNGYGYSDAECGLALAVTSFAVMGFQPLIGYLADGLRKVKSLLLCCLSIAMLCAISVPFIHENRILTYCLLFLFYVFFRSLVYIIDLWSISVGASCQGFSYGSTRSFGAVFYAVTALCFGYALDKFSYILIVPTFVFFALCTFLCVMALKEPVREISRGGIKRSILVNLKILFSNRMYIVLLLCYFLGEMTMLGNQNFMTRKFEVFGAGDKYTGLAFLIMGLLQLLPLLFMDKLRKHYSCVSLMMVCFIGFLMRNLIIAYSKTPLGLVSCYLTEPVAYGLYIGTFLYYMNTILPEDTRYLGVLLYSAITEGLGGIIGNYLAGSISQHIGVFEMMKVINIPVYLGAAIFFVFFLSNRGWSENDSAA